MISLILLDLISLTSPRGMLTFCKSHSIATFQLKLFVKLFIISLLGNLQGVQPISTLNDILARVSLYINGHIVFVPMEKQRSSVSQREVILYFKGQVLDIWSRKSASTGFSQINWSLTPWEDITLSLEVQPVSLCLCPAPGRFYSQIKIRK